MTEDQILRAGMMMKVLKLASTPGMDEVAIKLNCGLTWREKQHAKAWAKAFEISQTEGNLFEQAYKLSEAMK